jgi:phage shock protein PspC (stress-responsive transcriptional regulator)
MVAGVCGGLAEYFDVDPVIIRIAFVAATILSGIGIVAYILLWIIVPYKEQVATAATAASSSGASSSYAGSESDQKTASDADAASQAGTSRSVYRDRRSSRQVFGYILVGLGLIFFADHFFPEIEFHHFWPIVLIAIGIGLLLRSSKKQPGE